MGNKVQQIIQQRKGCIDKVKDINSYLSEIIYGVGDIGDLRGNVVFIGNQNSGSGNYSPISKIYFGTNAPTVNGYGKTLNGIPFYSVYDKTLYILNNPTNVDMDLSGNIYRRNIAPNNISASGFISGNSLNITGDSILGKNDTSILEINGKIKGSLIPLTSNTYDLGTTTNKWRNIYATSVSSSFSGDGSNLKNINTSMSVELIGLSTDSYNISLPSEKLTIYTNPTKGLNLTVGSKRVEITPYDATYSQKGVSYYNTEDFIVSTGYVSTNYTKLNALTSSFNAYTSSFQTTYNTFSSSVNTQFGINNTILNNLISYTSSIGNYSKVINTSVNQILVGSSSYSNTLNVNVLSNSSINFKLDDNLKISSSITTDNLIATNTLYVSSSGFIGGALQVSGNLFVNGGVTVIDSINVNIGDNIIGLNAAGTGLNGGIYVYDYVDTLVTASLLWDSTNNWWKAGTLDNEKRIVFQENNVNLITNSLTFANSNGRLISAQAPITNDIPTWNGTTWTNINSSRFATTSSLFDYSSSFQTTYNAFSSSVNTQFNNVNAILTNLIAYTSSFQTTYTTFSSSVNTQFTNTNIILNNLINYTSSFQTTYTTFSSSVNTQFINVNSALNSYISSTNTILTNLIAYTSSFQTTYSTFSSSVNTQFNNVNNTLNLLLNYSSSFQTTYTTFSSSVNTQFNNVNSTLNSYISSTNTILNNFSNYTSSLNAVTSSFFRQGGNIFGTTAILGTNDNFPLLFETNNTSRLSISSAGNIDIARSVNIAENLVINGSTSIYSTLYDSNLSAGSTNQFLRSNNTSVQWTTIQLSHVSGLLNYTSSISSSIFDINNSLNLLNSYTSSFQTTYNTFSSSVNTQFNNVNTVLNNFSTYTSSLNIATGSFFKQGGNSFGISGSLGTNDNFPLTFKVNNITRVVLTTDGKFTIGTVGTPSGLLNVGGDIIATGDVSAQSPSDIRLKKNILKIENASNILSKLNGYTFEWNDKQTLYNDGTKDLGLIAQEVEQVFPQIVGKRYDGYKSIKYDRLIPILVEAFNDLKKEFEYLKTKL
jgi:hypothetical protein